MQYKEIQEKFNKVISYSQGIKDPKTDALFSRWLESKRDFIEAMGGRLIWEWPEPVSFELGTKEKNLRIDDFIDMVCTKWQNNDLADFIALERDGFFSNQVMTPYVYPKKNIVIPKGMKLLKAFKYFEEDIKVLNDMQSSASMIIQEDKITGTLCLSVHPLDFLSTSENNHNWRSCHALDGEYKSGNLSYMIDKSTIICYLKSNKDEQLPNFPEDVKWNSKKWRVLLFFSDNWDLLFAGRQYPFVTEMGLNFVRERLLPAVHMNQWSPWNVKKIRSFEENGIESYFHNPYIPVGDALLPLNEVIINENDSLQFNDLLSSSSYDPVFSYRVKSQDLPWLSKPKITPVTKKWAKIHVGGPVKCLRCGENIIELSETMMCNDCEMQYGTTDSDIFATCPCCGCRYVFDEGYWVEGAEEAICPDCASEYTEYCSNCGERYYKDDMRYDRETESDYCKYCFEELNIREGI